LLIDYSRDESPLSLGLPVLGSILRLQNYH
jgi:hypothetical protein